ncbi:MAG: cobalamin biosynthesis protein CbiG [Zetaproteobacteria bacterium]|nr:MAG: cobalamin biosynthesis protein CbiG [Zetaproteobacteria bacterium]
MKVVLGIGCDRNASSEGMCQAIRHALGAVGLSPEDVEAVATIDRKADEPALVEVCRRFGWPLSCYPAERLKEVEVPNPSPTVMKYVGTPSVGEAAAILRAGGDQRALLLEKYKYRDAAGKHVTVSICRVPQARSGGVP